MIQFLKQVLRTINPIMRRTLLLGAFSALIPLIGRTKVASQQLPRSNPFSPAATPAKYERVRDYDLRNVLIRLRVDWVRKSFGGTVTHTLLPLRAGLDRLDFDAGPGLKIIQCRVDRVNAPFIHEQGRLTVRPSRSLDAAKQVTVEIDYTSAPRSDGARGTSNAGFHWAAVDRFEPARKPGFWTNGWPETNHFWVPIYDYPNDRTTVETYTTVPKGWFVLSNGALKEVMKSGISDTYHWKSTQTLSPYLISISGGEMDVVHEIKAGTELYYAVPHGEGALIRPSFGHTADMIAFFSRKLGVPYPWSKYGQSAVFDFIFGGMENASSTTLAENPLVESRSGYYPMDSLVSHELAHQWFGDLATYRDWSQAWLSEGFATYFQELYTEHSLGKDAFDRNRESALQEYLRESRRYKRPIVTRHYSRPDVMLDSHTYPKAALILHMLRRQLGDTDFFRTLGHYLRKNAYAVVDTNDLVRAIADETGKNVEPFFDQWIHKPGHPVLDYTWTYDRNALELVLDVSQKQDTTDGTPIYDMKIPVGIQSDGRWTRLEVALNRASQQFRIRSPMPLSVLLDPDHDLLIERQPYTFPGGSPERERVMQSAPNSMDRESAAIALLNSDARGANGTPGARALDLLKRETSAGMIANVLRAAGNLKQPELRSQFRDFVKHKDGGVRIAAIQAIAGLPSSSEDLSAFRSLVNEREELGVVAAALRAIGTWDADGNVEQIRRAIGIESRHEVIRLAAMDALSHASSDEALIAVIHASGIRMPRSVRRAAVDLLGRKFTDKVTATQTLIDLVKDDDPRVREASVQALINRKDSTAVSALRTLEQSSTDPAVKSAAKRAADGIEGK